MRRFPRVYTPLPLPLFGRLVAQLRAPSSIDKPPSKHIAYSGASCFICSASEGGGRGVT